MIRITSTLLTVVFALLSAAAQAEEPQRFSVRGAGLLDCAAFTEVRAERGESYAMIGGWIDGYLTAVNQLREDTYDITSFESTELVAGILANHCAEHPEHRLFPVLRSIVGKLHEHRISEPSGVVSVSNGVQRTVLYAPTVERLQRQLVAGGFLDTHMAGKFDAYTRQALMDFQQSVGFKPTGFPDQGTLWRLFSG